MPHFPCLLHYPPDGCWEDRKQFCCFGGSCWPPRSVRLQGQEKVQRKELYFSRVFSLFIFLCFSQREGQEIFL